MAFYDLSKSKRSDTVTLISNEILNEFKTGKLNNAILYFKDEDTYIRKSAYLSVGRIYMNNKDLRLKIISELDRLQLNDDFKVRQTVINAAGEIGKSEFELVQHFFDKGLFDVHHSPRNAVIGSVKKMGEVNPVPILKWAGQYLHNEDKEIRREICHGIELRGRTFPGDILALLKELQNDQAARVRNTLIHVIGQISYKKGCLETVIEHLNNWDNKVLVSEALGEIIDVHFRYKNFSAMTQSEARNYIYEHYKAF